MSLAENNNPTPKKGKGGRPAYKPEPDDFRKVQVLASNGIKQEVIAKMLGITIMTLHKYFKFELQHGLEMANASVLTNLHKQATKDDFKSVEASKFWLMNRAGFKAGESKADASDQPSEQEQQHAFLSYVRQLEDFAAAHARDVGKEARVVSDSKTEPDPSA